MKPMSDEVAYANDVNRSMYNFDRKSEKGSIIEFFTQLHWLHSFYHMVYVSSHVSINQSPKASYGRRFTCPASLL